jgi:Polymer-forming cytoskeletal
MSSHRGIITRLVARVKALLPTDWTGHAGEHFQDTVAEISGFAEEHNLKPGELLGEGVELGRRKLHGLANHEFSQAVKNFAETEKLKTEAELQRRSLESDIYKREAEAKRAYAEARLAELNVIRAELELLDRLQSAGVILHRDTSGNLTVLPRPDGVELTKIVERRYPAVGSLNLPPEILARPDGLYVVADYHQSIAFPDDRITVRQGVLVAGDITGLIVEILGKVNGDVRAPHVEIRKDGQLVGNVTAARIIIEDGAYFKGSIDIIKPSS